MRPNYDINIDYFAILGVHYGACSKTVKLAYRKMARRYHPDVSKIHDAQARFQEIAAAYEILSKYRDAYCREFDLRRNQQRRRTGYQQASPRNKTHTQADSHKRSSANQKTSSRTEQKQYAEDADKQTDDGKQYQYSSSDYQSAFKYQKPINGKNRVITYPLTLRYAIRLLNLGSFYIPGLKVKMKFNRQAFDEKTFRLEGKGYSGLFGGVPGDYLVKFNIKIDSSRYKLDQGDIYGTFVVPKSMLQPGKKISLDTVAGKLDVVVPKNYSAEKFIKIKGMGLPADEEHKAGDFYARLLLG
ncbi:DnaJ domain-containing protein [Thiomicrorhabdus sediminis]|uniref:DnaJ domain-containing protein n=1 Tax=Thiomicrorhabdus sediminis TaxID=2580412 RepID=UPI001EE8E196|nr:DnaJ domain-containing protein [Thiomicrorhabdus sediminis]